MIVEEREEGHEGRGEDSPEGRLFSLSSTPFVAGFRDSNKPTVACDILDGLGVLANHPGHFQFHHQLPTFPIPQVEGALPRKHQRQQIKTRQMIQDISRPATDTSTHALFFKT